MSSKIRTLLEEEIKNLSTGWLSDLDIKSRDYISSNVFIQSAYLMFSSPYLLIIAVNTYFAFFSLTAKALIIFFCKELSRQEEQIVRQGFFSFVLFSVVFMSVVGGANPGSHIFCWLLWLGFQGFMTAMHQVTYQRFKFVAPSSGVTGGRLSWLCFLLFIVSYAIFHSVVRYNQYFSISHFLFLFVDCLLSLLRSIHGLLRCLSASEMFSASPDSVRHFNYWLDLGIAIAIESVQALNYFHLTFHSPLGFNLTCLFFLYHIKQSFGSIISTWNRHLKHKMIFNHILNTYPAEKAPEDDLCIVCWETLGASRRLPCHHRFHEWCLMWWLAQDASCPTCRRVVSSPQQPMTPVSNTTTVRIGGGNGFFRFPSFAIEFQTGGSVFGPLLRRQFAPHDDSQLMGMALQIREMFPQLSIEAIIADLRISGSTQATTENILEGRVGFVGALPGDESEEDDDEAHLEDMSSSEEEVMDLEVALDEEATTEFGRKRSAMIARYRKKYIESSKGADLRRKGITS
ncbi:unnamed protein product [Auanema sp. JU1783]|nr:unnamed protein product [Auanema sp. JU1783]